MDTSLAYMGLMAVLHVRDAFVPTQVFQTCPFCINYFPRYFEVILSKRQVRRA